MSKVTKKKTSIDDQVKNMNRTLAGGPKDVQGALTKLKKCKGACTKEKQALVRAKAKSCGKRNKNTSACKGAADALKKGKYKFHPVYGYLRY